MPALFAAAGPGGGRGTALAGYFSASLAAAVRARCGLEHLSWPQHHPRLLNSNRILLVRRACPRAPAAPPPTRWDLCNPGAGGILRTNRPIGAVRHCPREPFAALNPCFHQSGPPWKPAGPATPTQPSICFWPVAHSSPLLARGPLKPAWPVAGGPLKPAFGLSGGSSPAEDGGVPRAS